MNSTEAKDGIAELVTVGPSGPSNLKPQQKIWLTRIGNSIIDALPGLFNCFRNPKLRRSQLLPCRSVAAAWQLADRATRPREAAEAEVQGRWKNACLTAAKPLSWSGRGTSDPPELLLGLRKFSHAGAVAQPCLSALPTTARLAKWVIVGP